MGEEESVFNSTESLLGMMKKVCRWMDDGDDCAII